jgi:predicted nuclease with RNAse H fold
MIAGVDYGRKLAGTTVLALFENGQVVISQSHKNEDADLWLIQQLTTVQFKGHVFLDAPLSLPAVYKGETSSGADYFYRQADKSLNAMSPMFLGGLTARAMKLSAVLKQREIHCIETYPAALAAHLGFTGLGYKKDDAALPDLAFQLASLFQFQYQYIPSNWHQFDAVLAMVAGIRYHQGIHQSFGAAEEGIIIF